jgi:hypothetical protein
LPNDPCEIVSAYFDRVRNRDVSVADLFHEDAVLIGLGSLTRGRAAIRDFYREVIERAGPSPSLGGPLMSSGGRVAAEIRITLDSGATVHALDLFEVENGKIRSVTYFLANHPDDAVASTDS